MNLAPENPLRGHLSVESDKGRVRLTIDLQPHEGEPVSLPLLITTGTAQALIDALTGARAHALADLPSRHLRVVSAEADR